MSPPEQSWRVAVWMSAAGGFLDAFTWIAHGGVFANAQTGNVVLLGVFAAAGDWRHALLHVPPICAFFAAVLAAHRLVALTANRNTRLVAFISLAIEILVLLWVATWGKAVSNFFVVVTIAFVAALQSACFSKVEGWPYSSVMTTGNLRRSADALFTGIFQAPNAAALFQAAVFGAICTTFFAGAALGAFVTRSLLDTNSVNAALLVPVLLLLIAGGLCARRKPVDPVQRDRAI
jgi:uncharacterized membrane protein YoaK (UPF0700 family)